VSEANTRAPARDRAPARKRKTVKPLDPPATEAELNRASEVWTAAQDVMVERGFARHLWGNYPASCHEFVVLMLRTARKLEHEHE
jgi:hypothetical protein